MITATETREVQAEGVTGGWSFFMAMGPKIMELLSGQYTNLPLAVLREYMANMVDAYVGVDPATTHPPRLHLPNELEPWVEFKDFGIGMDMDTVKNVFVGYGMTTKGTDNEAGGGFGIGSKVMFAFMRAYGTADQWTVESRYNGERMVFSCTKDEKGMPFMYHVATVLTEEHNGVTIRGPVPPSLHKVFGETAQHLLAYFPLKVEVTGQAVEQKAPQYLMSGQGWGMVSRKNRQTHLDSHAIIGGIPYKLDGQVLTRQAGIASTLFDTTAFDLTLPIGSVDIAPSREGLEYSNRTIDALKAAVAKMDSDLKEIASTKISSATTRWQALREGIALRGDPALSRILHQIEWQGEVLRLDGGVKVTVEQIEKAGGSVEQFHAARYKLGVKREFNTTKNHALILSPGVTNRRIAFQDATSSYVSRARECLFSTHARNTWDGKRQGGYDETTLYVIHPQAGKDIQKVAAKVRALFGMTDAEGLMLSTIELPARVARGAGKVASLKNILSWKNEDWSDEPDSDEEVEDQVFIRLSGMGVFSDDYSSFNTPRWIWERLKEAGLVHADAPLIGIPRSRSKVEANPGMIELKEFAMREVKKALLANKSTAADEAVIRKLQLNQTLISLAELLPVTHPVSGVANSLKKAKSVTVNTALRNLANHLKLPVLSGKPSLRSAGIEKVMSRYPMLNLYDEEKRYGNNYISQKQKEVLIQYIEQVDLLNYLNG